MGAVVYYGILAGIAATSWAASALVLTDTTPLEFTNRVLRRLRVPYSIWRLRGNWYIFRDEPGSLTPVIVAREIRHGFYGITVAPQDTVLDVGGHVGMSSIPWAKENPGVAFWCYEPDPTNYANLLRNIAINGAQNVFPVNAGIAREEGRLQVVGGEPGNTGGSQSRPSAEGVPAYRLADLVHLHDPTVLKVDVEGMEFDAVERNAIAGVPLLIMEVHGHLGNPVPMLDLCRAAQASRVQVIRSQGLDGIYDNGVLRTATAVPA